MTDVANVTGNRIMLARFARPIQEFQPHEEFIAPAIASRSQPAGDQFLRSSILPA
jgi:hypothetical protein